MGLAPTVLRMNRGLMSAFKFDSSYDGIEIKSVPFVCLNAPGRPNIEGKLPDGTIMHDANKVIAPEANVELVTSSNNVSCLRRKFES